MPLQEDSGGITCRLQCWENGSKFGIHPAFVFSEVSGEEHAYILSQNKNQ
jgi:hypothetical protein